MLLVHREALFRVDIGLAPGGDVDVGKLVRLELMVDPGVDLEAVILGRLRVSCKHETEAEVLIVWEVFSVESHAAMEFAHAFVHLTVFLEELELHCVAFRVVDGTIRDQVVELDVGSRVAVGNRLGFASVFLDKAWEAEFGQLSDHCTLIIFSFLF